jgi:hypothetical protein
MAKKHASRWSAVEAERELANWGASGKSLTAYARERGLNAQRLHWWKARVTAGPVAAAQVPAFAPAFIRSSPPATLRIGTEIVLEVDSPGSVSAEWLAAFAVAVSRR